MSKNNNLNEIHKNLTIQLKEYINAIIEKYGQFIPKEKLTELKSIKNYDNIIKIYDYGSINGYANSQNICLPLSAKKALNTISKIPGFGINKKHKTYNKKNIIINNNTFITYIIHVIISGKTTEEYYEDLLLHETMHYCGSNGTTALKEGINELLTRKLALDKNFKTNASGYPKEVAIAHKLESIWGENIINQIAFLKTNHQIEIFLESKLGKAASTLYKEISIQMEEEFYNKYYNKINTYEGISGILKKAINYKKINYKNIYILINKYNNIK